MSDICRSCDLLTIENYELKTEIERLLAVIEDADLSRSLLLDDFSNERAKVERLRAELATCRELREYDSKEIADLRAALARYDELRMGTLRSMHVTSSKD